MRSKDILKSLEDINVLCRYLYMDESNSILVDNGMCKIEIKMLETLEFVANNLNFPDTPSMSYTEEMTIPNILAIIKQLKGMPAIEFPSSFKSRWEEIKTMTEHTMALNRIK